MSLSEAVVLLAEQSLLIRTVLYLAALTSLSAVGGLALSLLVGALDAIGGALTADRDWDVLSASSSKEDVLNLFAVAAYATLLISIEPAIRALASAAGTAVVASLVLAPIAGHVALSARKRD